MDEVGEDGGQADQEHCNNNKEAAVAVRVDIILPPDPTDLKLEEASGEVEAPRREWRVSPQNRRGSTVGIPGLGAMRRRVQEGQLP